MTNIMKFPARRAISMRELIAVNKILLKSIFSGSDPSYSGDIQLRFQEEFLRWFGEVDGFMCPANSGTNALYIALKSLDLPKDSVVHISPITDPGSVSAVVESGCRINIMDSESGSGQASITSFEKRITPMSSAVLLVHHAGWAANNSIFHNVCRLRGLKLIEDFSQSHGAKSSGEYVGKQCDISAASTMFSKTLTTGGCGGIVYTKNEDLYRKVLMHRDRGKPLSSKSLQDLSCNLKDGNLSRLSALNHNLDDISAAIGCSSLSKLTYTIQKRRDLALTLRKCLDSMIYIPQNIEDSSPFVVPLTFPSHHSKKRAVFILKENNIPHNPNYKYLVGSWEWIQPYLYGDNVTPNAVSYIENSIFLYLNERYKHYHMRNIADLINSTM